MVDVAPATVADAGAAPVGLDDHAAFDDLRSNPR